MTSANSVAIFDRPVYALLGLPVDCVTESQASTQMLTARTDRTPCFLTTPNLNFLVASQTDAAFRFSVIDSDLVVADGMPIIQIAKLLGLPFQERVAGSSMIARIQSSGIRPPLRIFFFGGPPGVAQKAHGALERADAGIVGVGAHFPGFGSFSEMVAPEVIQKINAAKPDLVLVALGAKKGQAWIEATRRALDAPCISHLGAVVNFIAGTVARAPLWVQRAGLEWLWRIGQEPALFKRYLTDGQRYLVLLWRHIRPLRQLQRAHAARIESAPPARVTWQDGAGGTAGVRTLVISGRATSTDLNPIREAFKTTLADVPHPIEIDLSACVWMDAAFLGLLLRLLKVQRDRGQGLRITAVSPLCHTLLKHHALTYLLDQSISQESP